MIVAIASLERNKIQNYVSLITFGREIRVCIVFGGERWTGIIAFVIWSTRGIRRALIN